MSIIASILNAGTNNYQTPAKDGEKTNYWTLSNGVPPIGSIGISTAQKTGDFAVQAQTSPNKTVKVKSGKYLVKATPTSESERMLAVELSADYNVTIADNTTGSTRYDKILLSLDADDLHNPPANGDLTESSCLITERHTAANEAVSATNAVELAEVTVANGFSTIADTNIADKRTVAQSLVSSPEWLYLNCRLTRVSDTVASTSLDMTGKITIGSKIRWYSNGTLRQNFVVAISATQITISTSYVSVANDSRFESGNELWGAQYSNAESPLGFPSNSATFSLLSKNYAGYNSGQGSITTEADLTGLSIATYVPAGKIVKLTAQINAYSSISGDVLQMNIKEDTTVLQEVYRKTTANNQQETMIGSVVLSPAPGAHTYKLTLQRIGTGTAATYAAATRPGFILAEII